MHYGLPERVIGTQMQRINIFTEAGDELPPHDHDFPHMTYIVRGAALVRIEHPDGKVDIAEGRPGDAFLIPAGVLHSITSTMPDTRADCLYSHRDPQGRITVEYTGWPGAYK